MSARAVLNLMHSMLLEANSPEDVEEMLNPPTRDEERADRIEHLRSLGVDVG